MFNLTSRRGSVLSIAVAATAVVVIGIVGVASLSPWPTSLMMKHARADIPPTNDELAVLLGTIGLDAGTLAGAGVTAQETTSLVGAMRSYLGTHMNAIRAADLDCGNARVNYDALLRLIEAGQATEADLTAWASAPGTLSTAMANRQTLRDGAFTAAADGLSGAKASAITTARANHAHWDIQPQYLFSNRQEPGWIALRNALSNQRIATKHGESPDPAALAIITAADGEPGTALARANLEANLTTVTAAWNAAVYPR